MFESVAWETEVLFGIPVTRRVARNICPRSVALATELPFRTN